MDEARQKKDNAKRIQLEEEQAIERKLIREREELKLRE